MPSCTGNTSTNHLVSCVLFSPSTVNVNHHRQFGQHLPPINPVLSCIVVLLYSFFVSGVCPVNNLSFAFLVYESTCYQVWRVVLPHQSCLCFCDSCVTAFKCKWFAWLFFRLLLLRLGKMSINRLVVVYLLTTCSSNLRHKMWQRQTRNS